MNLSTKDFPLSVNRKLIILAALFTSISAAHADKPSLKCIWTNVGWNIFSKDIPLTSDPLNPTTFSGTLSRQVSSNGTMSNIDYASFSVETSSHSGTIFSMLFSINNRDEAPSFLVYPNGDGADGSAVNSTEKKLSLHLTDYSLGDFSITCGMVDTQTSGAEAQPKK